MRRVLKKTVVAALVSGLCIGSAAAADWSGFYGDVYLAYGVTGISVPGGGVQLGYNAPIGNEWYIGGEVDALMHADGSNFQYYTGKLRGGVDVGNDIFLFGSAGYGITGNNIDYWSVGIGGQYMIGNNTFLRGEADAMTPLGGTTTRTFVKFGIGMSF